jgi:hypothetical protein
VLIYVNDIIVTSSSDYGIEALLQYVNKDFAITDLGAMHFFWLLKSIKIQSAYY